MDREETKKYKLIAIDTVIKYAREQGVKLRRSDFPIDKNAKRTGNVIDVYEGSVPMVVVFLNNEGRWGTQLKQAGDSFLNYVNARILKTGIRFSFTFKELDLQNIKEETDECEIEKVIRKISKLLALSDLTKNPSENEAISASLAAQKLLAKYNLTMEEVTGKRNPMEDIEQVIADVGAGNKWKYQLADTVAANYACKCYCHGYEQIIFYGYKADVLIARRVFVYLFKVGNRLANQYVKKYRDEVTYSANGVFNSFVVGFVAGVRKELEKQCTALALVLQPEVQESFEVFAESFRKRDMGIDMGEKMNFDAYEEGLIEGKRALNAQYIEG